MQALSDLGIGVEDLQGRGIRIAKFGLLYPLDRRFAGEFAEGISTILVLEEKRSFLEMQLREVLYNLPSRPVIIGKEDEVGEPLLPPAGELDPDAIAKVVASRTGFSPLNVPVRKAEENGLKPVLRRLPNYCSGCPHNRSTLL